jgi:hypothetical protein
METQRVHTILCRRWTKRAECVGGMGQRNGRDMIKMETVFTQYHAGDRQKGQNMWKVWKKESNKRR